MNVIKFRTRESGDTIKALEALLQEARRGRIKGIIYGCDYAGFGRPAIGATGSFASNPVQAIAISSRLWRRLNEMYDAMEQ